VDKQQTSTVYPVAKTVVPIKSLGAIRERFPYGDPEPINRQLGTLLGSHGLRSRPNNRSNIYSARTANESSAGGVHENNKRLNSSGTPKGVGNIHFKWPGQQQNNVPLSSQVEVPL